MRGLLSGSNVCGACLTIYLSVFVSAILVVWFSLRSIAAAGFGFDIVFTFALALGLGLAFGLGPLVIVPSLLIVILDGVADTKRPLSPFSPCCRCIGPDVGPPCGGTSTCCSTSVSIEVSGMVGVNETVRVFDERRLLFDDLARVGV